MPPKRGKKRKAANGTKKGDFSTSTEDSQPEVIDRDTWPGWVEMESEPAFFNVMLRDMGVRGVRIQEVYGMDPDFLAFLPRPVHAFIFLFRYRASDEQDSASGSQQNHIWFANQIPDFACASVALLNIINNIPGLEMGKELRDFKTFTRDMSPMQRGDAIDNFDFVKHIHNSFATETDILNANIHTKAKVDKYKKKQAAVKAQETKRVKKEAQEAQLKHASVDDGDSAQTSAQGASVAAKEETNGSRQTKRRTGRSSASTRGGSDDEYGAKKSKVKTNGIIHEDVDSSKGLRRSGRARKPPKNVQSAKEQDDEDEAGFHFIAYMPVGDHVWKLDGLDRHPHDMGTFGVGGNGADGGTGDWIDVASPAMMQRMDEFAGAELEFNVMALVHDPIADETKDLLENVKTLQAIDTKLDTVFDDWRSMDGAETTKEVVTGTSACYGITQADVEAADLTSSKEGEINAEDDLLKLIEMRGKVLAEQKALRGNVRDAMATTKEDDEKARHRRHDYAKFVRSWLGALAEERVLEGIVNG